MKCEEKFFEIYGRDCEGLSFSPYRICPIGAHSDHNLGKITGFAIDQGIHIAYRPKQNGVIEMSSLAEFCDPGPRLCNAGKALRHWQSSEL